ncbi:MAG: hypothetical protein ABFR50_07735, partial [Candidatus Fermentibacteria bacterium]
MPETSPDIKTLKADKNENKLIEALDYHDDPDIPEKAVEALAAIGTAAAFEPLYTIMEKSDQSLKIRVATATAIGDICARLQKVLDKTDTASLSDDELVRHQEQKQKLSRAGSRLKLSMKSGPAELRKAAGRAYMILPLEDDSDIMRVFSSSSSVSFQSSPEPQKVEPEPEPPKVETPSEPVAEPEPQKVEAAPEPDAEPEPPKVETPSEPVAEPEPPKVETPSEPVAEPEPQKVEAAPEPDAEPE